MPKGQRIWKPRRASSAAMAQAGGQGERRTGTKEVCPPPSPNLTVEDRTLSPVFENRKL